MFNAYWFNSTEKESIIAKVDEHTNGRRLFELIESVEQLAEGWCSLERLG